MAYPLIENLTTKFSLSKDVLVLKRIKAFLLNQLHLFEVERLKILRNFGVQTLDQFNQLLIDNPEKESNLLESFQRTDYLTHQIEEISQWIKELNGNGRSEYFEYQR